MCVGYITAITASINIGNIFYNIIYFL